MSLNLPPDFLHTYWQKKPALFAGAFKPESFPLDPDEVAGLSCESSAHSRIVRQTARGWDVAHGPFAAEVFSQLEGTKWCLLVQEVDHWFPTMSALRDLCNFLPYWRMDDVMVSISSRGGSVGAHFDDYDVFLCQFQGSKVWEVARNGSRDLQDSAELKLLKSFKPEQSWTCQPGDILYLPAGVAHHGIALEDDCISLSIGFRAPNVFDLLTYIEQEDLEPDRFGDPDRPLSQDPFQIDKWSEDQLLSYVAGPLGSPSLWIKALGRYATAGRDPQLAYVPTGSKFPAEGTLRRKLGHRICYWQDSKKGSLLLFIDGFDYELSCQDLPSLDYVLGTCDISAEAFLALEPSGDLVSILGPILYKV